MPSPLITGNALHSFDIQEMMDHPQFSKRVATLSRDMCTLCLNELPNDTGVYQLQCPADICTYYLCHSCMKCVFSFQHIKFYQCFICHTQYQLKDAEKILRNRLVALDEPILQRSFEALMQDLPNQFKPEIIQKKEQQQQKIQPLKGFQRVITQCIMNPNMNEEQVEEVRQSVPNLSEFLEEQMSESIDVEETRPILSSTCTPAVIPRESTNEGQVETATVNKTIWSAICEICFNIWHNIKSFTRFVGNLIASVCMSLYRYLRYCPNSLRTVLKQQIDKINHYFAHSHIQ
ncbi:unnamed protein product [Rotaria socialis]